MAAALFVAPSGCDTGGSFDGGSEGVDETADGGDPNLEGGEVSNCEDVCAMGDAHTCDEEGNQLKCGLDLDGCFKYFGTACGDDEICAEGECIIEEIEIDPFEGVVDGVPAPGAACPIPEVWGYKPGENMSNIAFMDQNGGSVTLWDSACGAAVNWVYFTYGW
jgi:hypothetical protein